MAENPLLPNAQLRALHALLSMAVANGKATARGGKRAENADKAGQPSLPHTEALLAGALLQLCDGDVLVSEPDQHQVSAMLRHRALQDAVQIALLTPTTATPTLHFAAALARSLQSLRSDRLVLALSRTGLVEPAWAKVLASAEQEKLPLVFLCADPSGPDTFRQDEKATAPAPLNWTSAQQVASKTKLPVLSVDGADAVAVYRVVQESLLRARSGGGPAMIWAMLPTAAQAADAGKAAQPLRRLEHYLRSRKISLKAD